MRCSLFLDRDWAWHLVDVFLLAHSIFEFIMGLSKGLEAQNQKNVRMVRVVRIVRNVRIVRVMRLVGELRTMLYAIFGCFRALIGLICLLVLILYFFAVFFTQGATEYKSNYGIGADARMERYYGNLSLSMFTLYKAMTAGVAWGDVLQVLMDRMHWFYVMLFLLFISFALFAVLNVVTGVFVESALRRTQEEEETRLEEEARVRSMTVGKIRDLFCEIDADASGTVSIDEFMDALNDEYVMGCFELLDIETSEAEQLFHLLDPDSEGTVEIEEFVKGCLRLKGEAKSIDIAILMCETRRLMHKFNMFMAFVAGHFDSLENLVSGGNGIDWNEHAPPANARLTVGSQESKFAASRRVAGNSQQSTEKPTIRPGFFGGEKGRSWTQDLRGVLKEDLDRDAVNHVKQTLKSSPTARMQVDMLTRANLEEAKRSAARSTFRRAKTDI